MSDPQTESRQVISLIRVSTPKQAKDKKMGFDRQRRDVVSTCEQKNLVVVQEFAVIVSGTVLAETEDYRRLKAAVERKDIAGLVIPSVDRLTRTTDFDILSALINFTTGTKVKKPLFVKGQALDMTTNEGRTTLFNYASFAEQERIEIRRRTTEGKDSLRRESPSSKIDHLPTGVNFRRHDERYNDGTYSYDSEMKAKMTEAFHRVLGGESITRIAADLRFQSQQSLKNHLRSLWWIGYRCKNTTWETTSWNDARQKSNRKFTRLSDIERKEYMVRIPELADDPAVSEEVWYAVQDILSKNVKEWVKKTSNLKEVLLAHEYLHCTCCGRKFYGKEKHNRNATHLYYISGQSSTGKGTGCGFQLLRADHVDDDIRLAIVATFGNRKAIREAVKASLDPDAVARKQQAVSRVEREVKKIQREAKNLEDGAVRLGYSDDRVARIKAKEAELNQAELKLKDAKAALATSITDDAIDRMAERLEAEFRFFPDLDMQHQKMILARYVERIDATMTDPLKRQVSLQFKFKVPVIEPDRFEKRTGYSGYDANKSSDSIEDRLIPTGSRISIAR